MQVLPSNKPCDPGSSSELSSEFRFGTRAKAVLTSPASASLQIFFLESEYIPGYLKYPGPFFTYSSDFSQLIGLFRVSTKISQECHRNVSQVTFGAHVRIFRLPISALQHVE